MDATRVVLHGQAHARIDLMCDGELYRFTLTGPHMPAKMRHDRCYRDPEKLAHAIGDVLAEQVANVDADVIQVDEANLLGHPQEWGGGHQAHRGRIGRRDRARPRPCRPGAGPGAREVHPSRTDGKTRASVAGRDLYEDRPRAGGRPAG